MAIKYGNSVNGIPSASFTTNQGQGTNYVKGNADVDSLNSVDVTFNETARISAEERAKIVPRNIVDGVTILGVTGTAGGGGGGDDNTFVVNLTIAPSPSEADEEHEQEISIDATVSDILDAYEAGKVVILRGNSNNEGINPIDAKSGDTSNCVIYISGDSSIVETLGNSIIFQGNAWADANTKLRESLGYMPYQICIREETDGNGDTTTSIEVAVNFLASNTRVFSSDNGQIIDEWGNYVGAYDFEYLLSCAPYFDGTEIILDGLKYIPTNDPAFIYWRCSEDDEDEEWAWAYQFGGSKLLYFRAYDDDEIQIVGWGPTSYDVSELSAIVWQEQGRSLNQPWYLSLLVGDSDILIPISQFFDFVDFVDDVGLKLIIGYVTDEYESGYGYFKLDRSSISSVVSESDMSIMFYNYDKKIILHIGIDEESGNPYIDDVTLEDRFSGGGSGGDSNTLWYELPIYNYTYTPSQVEDGNPEYGVDRSMSVTSLWIPYNKNTGMCIYNSWESLLQNTQDINSLFDYEGTSIWYRGPDVFVDWHDCSRFDHQLALATLDITYTSELGNLAQISLDQFPIPQEQTDSMACVMQPVYVSPE